MTPARVVNLPSFPFGRSPSCRSRVARREVLGTCTRTPHAVKSEFLDAPTSAVTPKTASDLRLQESRLVEWSMKLEEEPTYRTSWCNEPCTVRSIQERPSAEAPRHLQVMQEDHRVVSDDTIDITDITTSLH